MRKKLFLLNKKIIEQTRKLNKSCSFILNVIIILLIFITPDSIRSSDFNFNKDNHKNKYGLKASNISGYGLFYNRRLSQNYYLQANGLVYYLDYDEDDGETTTTIFNYDFGLEIQRNILITDKFRFYFLAGGYYFYDDRTDITKLDDNSPNFSETEKEEIKINSYNIGIGAGFEYYFYKRAFVIIEIGYKFYEDKIKTLIDGEEPQDSPELERITKIGASIGIGYTF